eukprot:TRINITY_DN28473_c0_g1_i1.p2 TRINITY_DN28473_c0_g1~~TRINITY_DN28473_c0_g1_i1.p2  ORF type:complete len:100 (+),score=3.84 TRINITY_DN28473_c0_g1_i1:410-709(+)
MPRPSVQTSAATANFPQSATVNPQLYHDFRCEAINQIAVELCLSRSVAEHHRGMTLVEGHSGYSSIMYGSTAANSKNSSPSNTFWSLPVLPLTATSADA